MEGISRQNTENYGYPVGFGYITIPNGVDRDLYIETCYRKERVAIQLDDGGGVRMNCYVGKTAMQNIIFPEKFDQLGSAVFFIVPKFNNIPVIIDVVSKADETQLLLENSFKKSIHSKTASVSIEGRGNSGELFINVESLLENEGNIFITLKSKNNTAKFDVKCFGDINVYSEGETLLRALKTIDIQKIRIEGTEQIISSEMILSDNGFEVRDSFGSTVISDITGNLSLQSKIVKIDCSTAEIKADFISLNGNKSVVVTDLPAGSPILNVDCLEVGNLKCS